MLKDITLGQFFPGNTIVHRLDPRTKLLCVILYIVALFNAKSVLTYALVAAALTVCILPSKVHYKALTRGLKPVYIIVAFTAIMNLFFTGGTPVADVWLLRHITFEGIRSAIAMVLRIIMMIMGLMQGRVIRNILCSRVAPSSAAASCRSPLTVAMEATYMMEPQPIPCHTPISR